MPKKLDFILKLPKIENEIRNLFSHIIMRLFWFLNLLIMFLGKTNLEYLSREKNTYVLKYLA